MKKTLLVKAFTQDPQQGNPAGVVLDASGLSEQEMIAISAKLEYSESAFIFPSDKADFKIRFFTPTKEVPLCGHATIASFFALISENKIAFETQDSVIKTQETGAGVLSVICHKNGLIEMEQAKPIFYDLEFDRTEIAALLNISETDLGESQLQLVSTGAPKLLIPVKSLKILRAIKPNLEAMKQLCANSEVRGFYPFTTETLENSDFQARQFNPFAGINEDPVTGVAAGALGAYAVKHDLLHKNKFVIEQGFVLNKGGKMYVKVDGDRILVGGYAVVFDTKEL